MINKVILIGNLGKDPEQKNFDNGGSVVNFTMATSDNYKNAQGEWVDITDWHNIQIGGKSSDRAMDKLSKGSKVYIEGKLKTRSWGEGQDKKYLTYVDAFTFRSLDKKEEAEMPF